MSRFPFSLNNTQSTVPVKRIVPSQPDAGSARKTAGDFSLLIKQRLDDALQPQSVTCDPQSDTTADAVTDKLQRLGRITTSVPTVSDLLIRHPEYKKECWDIIYAKANIDKPYTRIPVGTDIYLNPATRELVWKTDPTEKTAIPVFAEDGAVPHIESLSLKTAGSDTAVAASPVNTSLPAGSETRDDVSRELASVARSFIGTPYREMNCYEMVVEGLQSMGVRYYGEGGLAERLKTMAARQGKSRYAYFNGEGLIQASGTDVYSKTIPFVDQDCSVQSHSIMKEMAPLLEKGMLLSFSTTSHGHTGIVSQQGPTWTFINSGWIDNGIESGKRRKAVGEEILDKEITNWLKRAARQNEPLQITVGRFGSERLEPFRFSQAQRSRVSLSRKV